MKTSKLLCLVFVLLSTGAFADAIAPRISSPALSNTRENLFALKVGRKFKGAVIEVYYSNGELVATQPLLNRKMVINFCDVKSGTYIIKVIKNNRVEEFTYLRK